MKVFALAAAFVVSLAVAAILSFTLIDQVRFRAALDSARIIDINDSATISLVGSRPALSLFFRKQSAGISEVDQAAITGMVIYLIHSCHRPNILVYGFSSIEPFRQRSGHEKDTGGRNQLLAIQRGQAVRALLVKNGYEQKAISVDATVDNASNYLSSNWLGHSPNYQLSRRVDIVPGGPLICEAYSAGGGLLPH